MTAKEAIWTKLSVRIYALLILSALLSYLPDGPIQVFGTTLADYFTAKIVVVTILVDRLARSLPNLIRGFQTSDALSAKRLNEQIKFTANLFNAVAVAILATFLFKEKFGHDAPTVIGAVPIIIFSLWVHFHARDMLGELKSEIY